MKPAMDEIIVAIREPQVEQPTEDIEEEAEDLGAGNLLTLLTLQLLGANQSDPLPGGQEESDDESDEPEYDYEEPDDPEFDIDNNIDY